MNLKISKISDISILRITFVSIALIGCLTIFNAHPTESVASANFASRQLIWLVFGILIMQGISLLRFSQIRMISSFLSLLSSLSLVTVLFFGETINGMRGWFRFCDFMFQPSEFAKPVFILALIATIEKKKSKYLLEIALLICGFILPVVLEPDYGGALIFIFILLLFIFLCSKKIYPLVFAFILTIAIFAVFALRQDYVIRRLTAFLNPFDDPNGAGWHILQFRYAIARGGVFGSGWGNCIWANSYLPLPHSDSSFATIAEASGFLGAIPLMIFFALLPLIGLRYARKQSIIENSVFIMLAFSTISFQAYIHIMVNLGLIPPTGLTLPLLSYGGSSLLSTFIIIGMIFSAIKESE